MGVFLITACSNKREFNSKYYCEKLNLNCNYKNQLAIIKTSKGNLQVKLNAEDYPLTVANFLENIKKNIYTNQRFYKIINYPQIKVIHAGIYQENKDFLEKNRMLNESPPTIPLEIRFKNKLEPKYKYLVKDPSEIDNTKNLFQMGSVSMVKSGARNSSSSEFFFVNNKFPELDGRYAIFGQVIKGFEVLEKIDERDFIFEINISN